MEPFDETRPTAMALPAGSFSLHHELAIHRSAPNHATHRRRRHWCDLRAAACARGWTGALRGGDAGAR